MKGMEGMGEQSKHQFFKVLIFPDYPVYPVVIPFITFIPVKTALYLSYPCYIYSIASNLLLNRRYSSLALPKLINIPTGIPVDFR